MFGIGRLCLCNLPLIVPALFLSFIIVALNAPYLKQQFQLSSSLAGGVHVQAVRAALGLTPPLWRLCSGLRVATEEIVD